MTEDRLQTAQASGGVSGTYPLETYPYDPIGNLQSKPGVGVYTYTASATGCVAGTPSLKPHAVSGAGTYTFGYDCNGNTPALALSQRDKRGASVTSRADSTGTFTQQWDKQNRLITVMGSATGYFVYDGDPLRCAPRAGGNRVKATLNGMTPVYIGNSYEQTGAAIKKYYYAGGIRSALNDNGSSIGCWAITWAARPWPLLAPPARWCLSSATSRGVSSAIPAGLRPCRRVGSTSDKNAALPVQRVNYAQRPSRKRE